MLKRIEQPLHRDRSRAKSDRIEQKNLSPDQDSKIREISGDKGPTKRLKTGADYRTEQPRLLARRVFRPTTPLPQAL
jgi:hypothetical protein